MPHARVSLWMRQQHNCARKYSHGYKSINLDFIEFPCLWLFSRLTWSNNNGNRFPPGEPQRGQGDPKPPCGESVSPNMVRLSSDYQILNQTEICYTDCILTLPTLLSYNLPIKLLAWGQTTNAKWGTPNPLILALRAQPVSSDAAKKKMVGADIPTNALVEGLCFVLGLMTWKIRVIYIIMS